jgi:hypothetical protein
VLHAVRHRLGLRLQIRTKNLASGVYLVRTREGPVVRSVGSSGAEVIKILRNAVGNEACGSIGIIRRCDGVEARLLFICRPRPARALFLCWTSSFQENAEIADRLALNFPLGSYRRQWAAVKCVTFSQSIQRGLSLMKSRF